MMRPLAVAVVGLLLVACSSEGADTSPTTETSASATTVSSTPAPTILSTTTTSIAMVLSDDEAIAAGKVAACKDGGFSDNTDFGGTCSSAGGVDHWLATFGSCSDGNVIKMSEDASCSDHDGFAGLLPKDFVPTPKPEDVARCKNGLYSSNTKFDGTCSSAGGVDEWLAPYGECTDGTVITMSETASCSDHGAFKGLLPADYVPAPPAAAKPTSQVPWGDYGADVQSRIDALAAVEDCAGLQAEFDAASANDTATRNRTGHGNLELMNYIDEWLRIAGCY